MYFRSGILLHYIFSVDVYVCVCSVANLLAEFNLLWGVGGWGKFTSPIIPDKNQKKKIVKNIVLDMTYSSDCIKNNLGGPKILHFFLKKHSFTPLYATLHKAPLPPN